MIPRRDFFGGEIFVERVPRHGQRQGAALSRMPGGLTVFPSI
jgi:hypothetical protein